MGRTSFPYVEAALKEALRVFPTAPTLVRETSRGVSLGGYSLAKGQIVAVSVYSMHHNSAYWVARPTTLVKACQTRGYCMALSLRMYLLARSNSPNAVNIEEREHLQHTCCFFQHVCLCHQPGVHSRIRRPTCQSAFCAGRPRQQRGPRTLDTLWRRGEGLPRRQVLVGGGHDCHHPHVPAVPLCAGARPGPDAPRHG